MLVLILGIIVFLGIHSVRIVAPEWRLAKMEQWGENTWKGLYSVISLVGFGFSSGAMAWPGPMHPSFTNRRHG